MTIINNPNLNFLLIFKLIFVAFLIWMHIFIYTNEKKISKLSNNQPNPEFKQSGFISPSVQKAFHRVIYVATVASTFYRAAGQIKTDMDKSTIAKLHADQLKQKEHTENIMKTLSEAREELHQSNLEKNAQKVRLAAAISEWQATASSVAENNRKVAESLAQALENSSSNTPVSDELTDLDNKFYIRGLNEDSAKKLAQLQKSTTDEFNKTVGNDNSQNLDALEINNNNNNVEAETNSTIDNIKENSVIPSYISDLLNNQSGLGQMCLGLLLGNYVILSSLASILAIFYGDYLITRFNIEIKYPKLAKVIRLRKLFQKYYLILSILSILTVVGVEVIFCLYVLTL